MAVLKPTDSERIATLEGQTQNHEERITALEAQKPTASSTSASVVGKWGSYIAGTFFAVFLASQVYYYQEKKGEDLPLPIMGGVLVAIGLSLGVNVPPELIGRIFVGKD